MGKSQKKSRSIQNQDNLQRINFLFSLSAYFTNKISDQSSKKSEQLNNLSRFYCSTLKSISKKTVQRLDPHVKHSICKRCNTFLIPSKTSHLPELSEDFENTSLFIIECKNCGTLKKFPTNNYKIPFTENFESEEF